MKHIRKTGCILLTLALMFVLLAQGASAVLNDGKELSVEIRLEAGRQNGAVFKPLAAGEVVKAGEVVTVRICPKNDFLAGATRYIVMYDKSCFQIVGSGTDAFTPNTSNSFYNTVASGFSGATAVPKSAWPASLVNDGSYDKYAALAVNNKASTQSPNGGYPGKMPGDWLFRFGLKALKEIKAGVNARIWMDKSWIATPDYLTGASYFYKCEDKNQFSATGSSQYYFDVDLTGADLRLPVTPRVQITDGAAGAPEAMLFKVPWYKSYKSVSIQLGYSANFSSFAKAEWSSDNAKVRVSQTGLLTNTGLFSRKAVITLKLTNSAGTVLASDTATVVFYKFNWQI